MTDEESSSEEESDDFDSSDESDDSFSPNDMENPADYFLKSNVVKHAKEGISKKQAKQKAAKQVVKSSSEESDDEEWRTVAPGDGSMLEPTVQAFEKGVEVTQDLVIKKVAEINANRGKRTSSIVEQIHLLNQVCKIIG